MIYKKIKDPEPIPVLTENSLFSYCDVKMSAEIWIFKFFLQGLNFILKFYDIKLLLILRFQWKLFTHKMSNLK